MRRVCILRHSYYPADVHVKRHVEALLGAGYEVDVVCLRGSDETRRERVGGATVHRMPVRHKRDSVLRYAFEYLAFLVLAAWQVLWLTLRRRPDIVEVYNVPDILILAALPARLLGSKVIFYLFEFMPEQTADVLDVAVPHWKIRPFLAFERLSAHLADHVVTWSPHSGAVFAARSLPAGKPLTVVPNVADSSLFYPRTCQPMPDGRVILFTHGSIIERYCVQDLVRAMPQILDAIPDLELRVFGEGEYLPALEELVLRLGLGEQVSFGGLVPFRDVPDRIAAADICVVPAAAEWLLPNKLSEYIAMKKPVVAARTLSMTSMFGEDAVRYFEPHDVDSLAGAITDVYRDREATRRRVELAYRQYYARRWEITRHTYLDVHEGLAPLPQSVTREGSHGRDDYPRAA